MKKLKLWRRRLFVREPSQITCGIKQICDICDKMQYLWRIALCGRVSRIEVAAQYLPAKMYAEAK
jgi:hypothetical protein